MVTMRISVADQVGQDMCAGAINGRELLSKLLALTAREPETPQPVFLDFEGVVVATGSFLRESVVGFRDAVRGRRSNFYPVVANVHGVVEEELDDFLRGRGDAILACDLTDEGTSNDVRTLGRLETKQQRILDLVGERKELDAAQLQREFGESDGVKQTAWNNRLAALAAASLVVELSEGRNKRYKPLLSGV
ncbi:MAG: hypothetical protein ACRED9_01755 [Caulobacteraceae bacterium]